MKAKNICTLNKSSSNFYPTDEGVFIEENFNIFFLKKDNKRIFFCRVPNRTWQANNSGVFWKDANKNTIFQVNKPGGKAIVICDTKEEHWMLHESGGIFLLKKKQGELYYFKKNIILNEFLNRIKNVATKNFIFKNEEIVCNSMPNIFFPFDRGYFYHKDNSIYYKDLKKSKNIFCCLEPANGDWNAFNGQIVCKINGGLSLECLNRSFEFNLDFQVVNFKGSKDGVYVLDLKNNVLFYPKPDWAKGSNSLSEF